MSCVGKSTGEMGKTAVVVLKAHKKKTPPISTENV